MYNYMLETFIVVAENGSFSRAADKLFMSSTAVMKQINTLEKHLGLRLFERSPSGIRLTDAGGVILRDARFMIDFSERSVAEARLAEKASDNTFCIGSSALNPAKPFFDLWYKPGGGFSDFKLNIVPFEDSGILSEIAALGKSSTLLSECATRKRGLTAAI